MSGGAHAGWPLAIAQGLVFVAALTWLSGMVTSGTIEWRRTALDVPVLAIIALVLVQLVIGNRALVDWALAPAGSPSAHPIELPHGLLVIGSVAPHLTGRALTLFLSYVGVYVLVVNAIRTRRQLDRLVRHLVGLGGVLGFLALADYLSGQNAILFWRDSTIGGRLTGTFVNPDHFGTWLGMLVCLGLGRTFARRSTTSSRPSLAVILASRRSRERALREVVPFVAIGVMAIALVFTLSRGAIAALLLTLAVFLLLAGVAGRARWALVAVGVMLAIVVTYAVWIGVSPLLQRVWEASHLARWHQAVSSLPMIRDFPLVGVGLGAYRVIYFRYQPASLQPGDVYFPYAHNDPLQVIVELGLIGATLSLIAGWRLVKDLVLGHVLGIASCPVGGGEGAHARRHDPFSTGLAVGALCGGLVALVHATVDFSARIPANGMLAAACLGIATVALHTRFGADERYLADVIAVPLAGRPLIRTAAYVGGALITLALVVVASGPARVDAKLRPGDGSSPPHDRLTPTVLDPRDPRIHGARAQLELDAARTAPRSELALAAVDRGIDHLRVAIRLTPTDPFLHERLGWAHATAALITRSRFDAEIAAAVTHLQRSIALAPDNPYLHRSLAILAGLAPDRLLALGLDEAREALQRDPRMFLDVVDQFRPLALTDAQWLTLAPNTTADQLALASALERRSLRASATAAARQATRVATSPADRVIARWMLATLLSSIGEHRAALDEMDRALKDAPRNPEIHLTRARALGALGEPPALDAFRMALAASQAGDAIPTLAMSPFASTDPRLVTLVRSRLQPMAPARYQRALAEHLTQRGLWEPAATEWRHVLTTTPEDAGAHSALGVVLDRLGRMDEALAEHREAVARNGDDVGLRLRLADGLWRTGQLFQAIAEWRAVVDRDAGNVHAWLLLARAHTRVGERAEALRGYRRVASIDPSNQEARDALGRAR